MNKRMKKKHALEERVRLLESYLDFALHGINANHGMITKIEAKTRTMEISFDDIVKTVARNAQATNNRFDEVETYQRILEDNLKDLEKKQSKKSWFRHR